MSSLSKLQNKEIIDALEGSGMAVAESTGESSEGARDNSHMFTAALFAIFVLLMLVAIAAGTMVYNSLHNVQTSANDSRLGVSLLANMVHANDAVNAVAVGEGPEGSSLVLREVLESGTYETRIYLYQGNIVEEYVLEGTPYTPEQATQIVASDTFTFSYKGGLLSIGCDQGTAQIALRSLVGGA